MRGSHEDEDKRLRSVALRNANSILLARQRAEAALIRANESLEQRSHELAQSLSMTRATLEATTDAILVTDDGGSITGFNEKYVQMWNVPRAVMNAADHRRLLDINRSQVKDAQEFSARTAAIEESAPVDTFDLLELADGRFIERHSRIQRVDSRRVGRVWSFCDITERRRVEDALRDETRILELLNNTGRILASTLELKSLLQTATDAATALSGARFGALYCKYGGDDGGGFMLDSPAGATGRTFEQFGHYGASPFLDPGASPFFAPILRGEGPLRCDDVAAAPGYARALPGEGALADHRRMRSYLGVAVTARSGDVMGGLFLVHPQPQVFNARTERIVAGLAAQTAVAIDNSRLYAAAQQDAAERARLLEAERRARAHAERMSELKDEFLATLSHELRTPLNAMLGWSQVLKNGARSAADLAKGLDAIERNARVQTQLIEDLLDMSRITSGNIRLDVRPLMPIAVIDAALETVRPAANAKGIAMERLLEPTAGPISADPIRLQQVVCNLLSNAIKFTPAGGRIQIVLGRSGEQVEIGVVDTGVGIRPEFLPFVFDRFRQADASTTRSYEGLGLGLSIVKHLVELHGGTVQVSSRGEGLGARFTAHFPLAVMAETSTLRTEAHALELAAGDADKPDLAGITVLAVDDEADARELVSSVLACYGARVLVARSAAEALVVMDAERPDVLLSDIGMPDVDGYELLRRIRALGPGRGGALPAIALTAFAGADDRVRALDAGFVEHVTKPIEPAALAALVARVVVSRR